MQTSIMHWKSTPVSLMLFTPYKDDVCLLSCNIMYMQGVSMPPTQLQAKRRPILLKAEKVL